VCVYVCVVFVVGVGFFGISGVFGRWVFLGFVFCCERCVLFVFLFWVLVLVNIAKELRYG
jgi:hypothetical protein